MRNNTKIPNSFYSKPENEHQIELHDTFYTIKNYFKTLYDRELN